MSEYVVYDIETTGFSAGVDEITQVAAERIRIVDGAKEVLDTFNRYVKINGMVPQNITDLTGITKEKLEREGVPVEQVMREFEDFCSDAILVAHNGKKFDSKFICTEMDVANIGYAHREIDTLILAKKLWNMKKNSLGALIETFGLEKKEAHRADSDVSMLSDLFLFMLNTMNEKYDSDIVRTTLYDSSFYTAERKVFCNA